MIRSCCVFLLVLICCQMFMASEQDKGECDTGRVFCLIIFDFDDFFCFSCLESFLCFIRYIPHDIRKKSFWGVLVYDSPATDLEKKMSSRIAEKKLRGFKEANQIDFPILIDHGSNFKPLCQEGSVVFLFSKERYLFRHYYFPLSQKQMDEILSLIRSR